MKKVMVLLLAISVLFGCTQNGSGSKETPELTPDADKETLYKRYELLLEGNGKLTIPQEYSLGRITLPQGEYTVEEVKQQLEEARELPYQVSFGYVTEADSELLVLRFSSEEEDRIDLNLTVVPDGDGCRVADVEYMDSMQSLTYLTNGNIYLVTPYATEGTRLQKKHLNSAGEAEEVYTIFRVTGFDCFFLDSEIPNKSVCVAMNYPDLPEEGFEMTMQALVQDGSLKFMVEKQSEDPDYKHNEDLLIECLEKEGAERITAEEFEKLVPQEPKGVKYVQWIPGGKEAKDLVVNYASNELSYDPEIISEVQAPSTGLMKITAELTSGVELNHVRLFRVNNPEITEHGKVTCQADVFYEASSISFDRILLLEMELGETVPLIGIMYTAKDGTPKAYGFGMSGLDGSLTLDEVAVTEEFNMKG